MSSSTHRMGGAQRHAVIQRPRAWPRSSSRSSPSPCIHRQWGILTRFNDSIAFVFGATTAKNKLRTYNYNIQSFLLTFIQIISNIFKILFKTGTYLSTLISHSPCLQTGSRGCRPFQSPLSPLPAQHIPPPGISGQLSFLHNLTQYPLQCSYWPWHVDAIAINSRMEIYPPIVWITDTETRSQGGEQGQYQLGCEVTLIV